MWIPCVHYTTVSLFFFPSNFVIAGSDEGSIFIWDRDTGNIRRILKGDDAIVNCLQPHPTSCLLATSGIDPVVRLWSPMTKTKVTFLFSSSS